MKRVFILEYSDVSTSVGCTVLYGDSFEVFLLFTVRHVVSCTFYVHRSFAVLSIFFDKDYYLTFI